MSAALLALLASATVLGTLCGVLAAVSAISRWMQRRADRMWDNQHRARGPQ